MSRVLSPEQLEEAKQLRLQGFTKRQLAKKYGVGQTTIWDNVFYYKGKRVKKLAPRPIEKPKILRYKIVVYAIQLKKQQGFNSGQIANEFSLPLSEVNYIYSKIPCQIN